MTLPTPETQKKTKLGWREWLALPDLGIPAIKAKIDTGARTSALHVCALEAFERNGQTMVRFSVHPLQRKKTPVIACEAPVIDQRIVSDSGGHRELRYVIAATVCLGELSFPIELTLSNRDGMLFRMLLGRTALADYVVYPTRSYRLGKTLAKTYKVKKPMEASP